eukprot:5314457-Ditylum_brightwellii.AAC.1
MFDTLVAGHILAIHADLHFVLIDLDIAEGATTITLINELSFLILQKFNATTRRPEVHPF